MAKGGLSGISEEAKSLAFDLSIPIAMLAAGAGKVSVAWMAFSAIWTRKVLGPMADFTGIAAGAIGALHRMASAFKDFGMGTAASMESAVTRFKPFLKGIESAKQRISELARTAAETPFSMEQVIAASQQLENLTRGALATGDQLKMVGDVAAMTGRDLETTAYWIGRLYDAVQSGRPIGEATMRLQEMGAVSGTTRNQLESLTESGAASNEVWKVAEKEFSRASGSMKDMSQNLEGLQRTLADNKSLMGAAFSNGYLEGEKAMVAATAQAYDKLTPIMEDLGQQLSIVSNKWEKFKAGVLDAVTSSALFAPALKTAGAALTVFLAAVQGATAIKVVAWVAPFLKSLVGSGGVTAGSKAATTALGVLGDAMRALLQGNTKGAKWFGLAAASKLKDAGAAGVLTASLKGLLSLVVSFGKNWLGPLLINPVFLLAAALAATGLAIKTYVDRQDAARESSERFSTAMQEQLDLVRQNGVAIRTLADRNKHYSDVLHKLADARRKVTEAEAKEAKDRGNPYVVKEAEDARKQAETLKKEAERTARITPDDLEKEPGRESQYDAMQRQRQEGEMQFAADLDKMTPEQQMAALERRARETTAKVAAAEENSRRFRSQRDSATFAGGTAADAESQYVEAKRQFDQIRDEIQALEDKAEVIKANTGGNLNPQDTAQLQLLKNRRVRLHDVLSDAFVAKASATRGSQGMDDVVQLDDPIAKARLLINLIDQAQAGSEEARQNLDTYKARLGAGDLTANNMPAIRERAQGSINFAVDVDKQNKEKAKEYRIAADQRSYDLKQRDALAKLDQERAAIDASPEGLSMQEAYLDNQQKRLDLAKDITTEERKARQAELDAQRSQLATAEGYKVAYAALDINASALELQDEGLAKSLEALNLERAKTELKIRQQGLNAMEAEAERARNDGVEASLRRQADLLQKQAALETARARAGNDFQRAMLTGSYRDAFHAKKREEGADDAIARNQLTERSKQMFEDPARQAAYVESQMQLIREQRKLEQDKDTGESRRQSQLKMMQGTADLLDATGNKSAAKRLRKKAGKLEDAENYRSRMEELVGQGMTSGEANHIASRERLLARAQREQEGGGEAGSFSRGAAVADSMQRIGGGGGFYGTPDHSVPQKLDKTNALLSQIRDQGAGGHAMYFED